MSALEKLRRLFARSPISPKGNGDEEKAANQPDGIYKEQLELLSDRAKDLRSDPWLSNHIRVSMSQRDGAYSFDAHPLEAPPYVRAANSILKDKLPGEVRKHFEVPRQ